MKSLWPRSARTLRLALLVVVGLAGIALTSIVPALALPILTQFGGKLFYTGGDVTIDVLHYDSVYGEVLQLWSGQSAIDIVDGTRVGSRVTLTEKQLADLGIKSGDELQFGIHVTSGASHDYVLGPGSRNGDGIDHAYVRSGQGNAYVGFEDMYGGGDRDYNDTIYRFSGVSAFAPNCEPISSAPEPGSMFLVISGIGLLGLAYRRR